MNENNNIEKIYSDFLITTGETFTNGMTFSRQLAQVTRTCETCRWYNEEVGACCNADSEYFAADFTVPWDTCDKWEA